MISQLTQSLVLMARGEERIRLSQSSDISRRRFVVTAAAATTVVAPRLGAQTAAVRSESLLEMSAVDAVEPMRRGILTAERTVWSYLINVNTGKH